MAIEQYNVMEQNNELVFKNTSNGLLYNENEILEKISKVKSTDLDVFVDKRKWTDRTNLTLNKDIIVNRNIEGLKIYSNNGLVYHIYTSFKANNIWAKWLFKIVEKFDNEQKEISDDVKSFFEKNENIFNYNYEQINTILNHSSFKHPTQSKRKIMEIIGKKFKTESETTYNNICNSKQIDKNVLNNYSEEIKKIVLEKIKLLYRDIIGINLIALSIPLLIKLWLICVYAESILLTLGCSLLLLIAGAIIHDSYIKPGLFKFIKYKRILHMLNPKNEKTLSHINSLSNNTLETKKEDIPVRKEIYLESLKECIKLMAENPNIDWTIEKKKIMILAEGYTKYKKTSQLDNITLLQTCPTFMSELCDLEITIKNKINANKKEDVYEEDLAEITTLLDNIKTPEMALKLERKL